jgi:hypothetical protein
MRTLLLAAVCLLTFSFLAAPAGASPPPGYDPKSCRVAIETHGIDAHCTYKGITAGGYVDCSTQCDFTGYEWECFFSSGGPVEYFSCPVPPYTAPDAVCTVTPTSAGVYGSCLVAGTTYPIQAGCDTCVPLWVGPTCTIGVEDGAPVGYCTH